MKSLWMMLSLLMAPLAATWAEGGAQAIDIQSPTMEANRSTGDITFSGGVTVTRGDLILKASKVVAEGSKGKGDISRIRATGNVVLTRAGANGPETATGDAAVFNPQTGDLDMTGAVTLTRGPSTLSGSRLTYSTESGNVRVTGGSGQVKARFVPQPKAQ